jgi:cell division protein FtsW
MDSTGQVDRVLLTITCILLAIGFFIVISASLGLFATGEINFVSIAMRQFILGIIGGLLVMYVVSRIPYTFWRSYALPIFLASLLITGLTFIPGISFSHGGATRWVDLGFITFQPVEILKVGFVIYIAGWCAYAQEKIHKWQYSLLPFAIILAVVGTVLLLQPDTGNLLVMLIAAGAMFVAAGTRWLHIFIAAIGATGALGILAISRPYLQERIMTFLNPAANPFGSGYQVQQSLIAIGSGDWFGRGFGQSIQKFSYLPEPISDSIFAVFAEEWGFVGVTVLLLLFTAFILRGYALAADSPDTFSRILVVGIVSLIAGQIFVNLGGMLGILPLSGLPLTFISHGGTALVATLGSVGVILNISRHISR